MMSRKGPWKASFPPSFERARGVWVRSRRAHVSLNIQALEIFESEMFINYSNLNTADLSILICVKVHCLTIDVIHSKRDSFSLKGVK